MNILFICNGNVARSQEAEYFYNKMRRSPNDIATSAGINVKIGKPIDPVVIEVMDEAGYDLRNAVRKFVNEEMVEKADMIVSFKPADELPEYISGLSNVAYWNTPDPQGQPTEFHRKVRDEVKMKVSKLV